MMKKLYTLILLFLSSSLFALPIGDLYEATYSPYGIGFYGDYISNRHLQVDSNQSELQINKSSINTNAAYFSYNKFDRINLFGTLGASQINLVNQHQMHFKSQSALSYSFGFRAIALKFQAMAVGFEASYFSTKPEINSITHPSSIDINYLDGQSMLYRDWQIALAFSTQIPFSSSTNLSTFVGVKYDRATLSMGDKIAELSTGVYNLNTIKNDLPVGINFGMTLAGSGSWSISAEERLIDEKAFCITGQLHF